MSAHLSRPFAVVALAFAGAVLLAFGGAQEQPAKPPVPPPPAEERLATLEKTVAEQKARLEQLERLCSGLVSGVAKLAAGGEKAKAGGFESAGPNPAARTALLDGIAELANAVKDAQAPAAKSAR